MDENKVAKTAGFEQVDVAASEERQNKLLRLLGGKKAGNLNAAADWINKSRSVKEEQSLKKGLEAQYNASLNLRLSGKSRRHEGIGFECPDIEKTETHEKNSSIDENTSDNNRKQDEEGVAKHHRERDRSRSPLRKEKKDSKSYDNDSKQKDGSTHHNNDAPNNSHSSSITKPITKKNFYMQFKKSND